MTEETEMQRIEIDVQDDLIIDILYKMIDYIRYYKRINALNDCNTCGCIKGCPYVPRWGEPVRINCPLYSEREPDKEE